MPKLKGWILRGKKQIHKWDHESGIDWTELQKEGRREGFPCCLVWIKRQRREREMLENSVWCFYVLVSPSVLITLMSFGKTHVNPHVSFPPLLFMLPYSFTWMNQHHQSSSPNFRTPPISLGPSWPCLQNQIPLKSFDFSLITPQNKVMDFHPFYLFSLISFTSYFCCYPIMFQLT